LYPYRNAGIINPVPVRRPRKRVELLEQSFCAYFAHNRRGPLLG